MNISALFIAATLQFHLPANLLSSLCYVESTHDVNAYHMHDGRGNSVGICQIKLSTAQDLGFTGTEQDLLDPRINIYYAAAYLAHQRSRYHGDIKKAVISYNMGSAKGFTTTAYSAKVFKQLQEVSSR